MRKAFLLGAGLGTRLQPLTNTLPKPLIPFQNRPLITHVLDQCLAAGIVDFAINTHHLPETWLAAFPENSYRDAKLTFFHEPDLLETGGGIKNIADWIGNDQILVHNADILSNIPLDRLMTGHMASNNVATLAAQDHGPQLHLALDGHRISDISGLKNGIKGTHQFTGIYCLDPEILDLIPPNEKISIIPAFLKLIETGELGAYLIKGEPSWIDIGTRASYLKASFAKSAEIHPSAHVDESAKIANSWIGADCEVGENASLDRCILWPGTKVLPDAQLTNCVVHRNSPAAGSHHDADL